MNRRVRALAALCCVVGLGACRKERPPNVLLIVVDAWRAERLGVYGAKRPTTPALDTLAAESVVFDRAYAAAPWTKPSVASILTGLYPSGHGLRGIRRKLVGEVASLPTLLGRRGYATAGVVANALLSAKAGFGQGFEVYREDQARGAAYVSSEGLTEEAIAELDRMAASERPFFLYVHYFDPHADYRRHAGVGFAGAAAGRLHGDEPYAEVLRLQSTMTPEEVEFVRAEYDEELRHTDDSVGALLAHLRSVGRWADTLVVVTADHGEELHDRGVFGHTRSLYDELVRVPLVIKPPGAVRARRVAGPVSLVSIAPTVLDFAGDAPGPLGLQGRSLVSTLREATAPRLEDLLCEVDFLPVEADDPVGQVHKKALIAGDLKLVRDDTTGALELYDLAADPGERTNLAPEDPAAARRLLARLLGLQRAVERSGAAGDPRGREQEFSHEELDRLRSLGYVGH